jgi:2-phosphosulfolactate phosphatase
VLVNTDLAEEVLIGSFANAHAIIEYIKERNPEKVTLIPVGFDLIKPGREDELCAQYIRGELLGNPLNFETMQKEIREGEVGEQRR